MHLFIWSCRDQRMCKGCSNGTVGLPQSLTAAKMLSWMDTHHTMVAVDAYVNCVDFYDLVTGRKESQPINHNVLAC